MSCVLLVLLVNVSGARHVQVVMWRASVSGNPCRYNLCLDGHTDAIDVDRFRYVPLARVRFSSCFLGYRTVVNGSLDFFGGRDKSKANFFFCFAFLWVVTGDSQLLLALRSIKSSKGTGGQAGNYCMPFVERLRRGHLVIRLSAVTHLAQCRSEQLVSMSSPSRNSLNDSQANNDVSVFTPE